MANQQKRLHIHALPGHLIRRMHQHSDRIFHTFMRDAGLELTPVQFAAMDAIRANPGIDQAGVAELIAYDRATIGGVIDRLQQKGLVDRQVSRRDRRAREVTLTEAGEALYALAEPVTEAMQRDILHGLTEEEREEFLSLAVKLTRAHARRVQEKAAG